MKVLHDEIALRTRGPLEFFDLTEEVARLVRAAGVVRGIANVQTRHTTTAIVVNENEPLLLQDMKRVLETLAPREAVYRHDDLAARTVNLTPDERRNGHSHCRALCLGASETLNVAGGELDLGRWQRIFLVELDGERERRVSVLVMGE